MCSKAQKCANPASIRQLVFLLAVDDNNTCMIMNLYDDNHIIRLTSETGRARDTLILTDRKCICEGRR
jgi:hypothetical protein